MAANLVKAGHEVTVWNRTPREVEGAKTAATPAEAARDKDAVWVCVSDTKAVQAFFLVRAARLKAFPAAPSSSTPAPSRLPPACSSWKACRKKAVNFSMLRLLAPRSPRKAAS